MTELGTPTLESELDELASERPHLRNHLENHYDNSGEYPLLADELDDEHEVRNPNVIYQVADQVFVHIYGDRGIPIEYKGIEPRIYDDEDELIESIKERLLEISAHQPPPSDGDFEAHFEDLLSQVITVGSATSNIPYVNKVRSSKFSLTQDQHRRISYILKRDITGLGPLDPLMQDDNNEDIHIIGPHQSYVDHGVYGLIPTTIGFGNMEDFEDWVRNMGERIENPVSDANPIVDNTLPDGSRLNLIYSDDVSVKGPSLTIRQGEETPLSINQITQWGTLSPKLAAYLWMCLENERTVFVVGETASGKTTTLNSILTFIPNDSKIYTAEDTAEVEPPQDAWQQLLTREGQGQDESSEIDMFDLVAAALRSRPDYIIVGEVRGPEAKMAFQAAQTGHPVMLTFHASDIVSMVQRMTGDPINVPEPFMGNADVALFQNRVKQGDEVLRRVTTVQEIEGYSEKQGGVITREAFSWDPTTDEINFTGQNNSYVLEDQIATLLGYEDTTEIYDELDRRAEIVERMIDNDILSYYDVADAIDTIQRDGVEALDINTSGLSR